MLHWKWRSVFRTSMTDGLLSVMNVRVTKCTWIGFPSCARFPALNPISEKVFSPPRYVCSYGSLDSLRENCDLLVALDKLCTIINGSCSCSELRDRFVPDVSKTNTLHVYAIFVSWIYLHQLWFVKPLPCSAQYVVCFIFVSEALLNPVCKALSFLSNCVLVITRMSFLYQYDVHSPVSCLSIQLWVSSVVTILLW